MDTMTAAMVLTGVNVLLMVSLFVVYVRSFMRMRSAFTAGLLVFTALFLLENAVTFYYYVTMMPLFVAGLEGFALFFTALQTAAFAILNWLAWK